MRKKILIVATTLFLVATAYGVGYNAGTRVLDTPLTHILYSRCVQLVKQNIDSCNNFYHSQVQTSPTRPKICTVPPFAQGGLWDSAPFTPLDCY